MKEEKRHESYSEELGSYLIGFGLALLLTLGAFGTLVLTDWSRSTILVVVSVAAILQAIVHFRYFLHIDLTRQKREDLHLILFTFLLLLIMGGGTIWIMKSLHERMM